MLRRVLILMALAGVLALIPASSASAQRGGTCALGGNANFSPGLTATPSAVSYTFTGSLSNCQSTGTATSGTISASGSGSDLTCASGSSTGTATINWNNGNSTTESFTTTSTGALVTVQSTATSSTEPAIAAGDQGLAELVFQTQTPQDCAAPTGLTSASFSGQIGSGGA
jgi:hypothetical protein